MTPVAFARLALALDGATQGTHGGHPDFRAGGKVFASMGFKGADSATVKLTPEQQEMLVAAEPAIFTPAKGGWGLKGSTLVRLEAADEATVRSAMGMAVARLAAKR